ncbi:MAG: hypothetical protein IJ183_04190 [Prevotella sp.]|nr:hypothetical protein [Prevotella sp.]
MNTPFTFSEEDIKKIDASLGCDFNKDEYCYIDGDDMVIKRQDDAVPIRVPLSETEI